MSSYLGQIVRGSEIWWFMTSAHSLSILLSAPSEQIDNHTNMLMKSFCYLENHFFCFESLLNSSATANGWLCWEMKFENRGSARVTLVSYFVVANDVMVILFVVCNVLAFFLCTGVPMCYFIPAIFIHFLKIYPYYMSRSKQKNHPFCS